MRGLYCITPDYLTDPKALNNACRAAIRGGAQIIQYRQKTPGVDRIALAYAVMDAAAATTARVLINDDPLLAQQVGADGCHLGQTDGAVLDARMALGVTALIGRTCHDRIDLMQQAIADGADYCAFGRLFQSQTKHDAHPLALEHLVTLIHACSVPTVAIGGITATNAHYALDAGVDMLAVSDAVFGAVDIEAAASALACQF